KSPDDENAPILIQCGRKNSPGEMFRIQVRQDMKTLIFSSSADSLATCTVDADCSAGAQILVCFNNDQGMRVIVSFQTSDPSSIWQARALPFNLGPVDDELAPLLQLQLGGANGADGIGFSGSIGKLLLFDRDIFPLLAQDTQNQDRNQIEKNLALISAWVNDARVLTPFFDGLLSPSELKYVGAMVGFAVLPAARKPARPLARPNPFISTFSPAKSRHPKICWRGGCCLTETCVPRKPECPASSRTFTAVIRQITSSASRAFKAPLTCGATEDRAS